MSDRFELEEHDYYGSGHWFMGVAGTALGNRKLVRIGADGLIYLADASAAATMPCMGITLATAVAGQNIKVLVQGFVYSGDGPWTPGSELYVSDTAGEMAHVAGTVSQEVGIGYSTTIVYFDPARGGGAAGGEQDVFYEAPNPDDYKGFYASMLLVDAQSTTIRQTFYLPNNYLDTWGVDVIVIPDADGNLRWGVDTNFGAVCTEDYDTHTDAIALGQTAVLTDIIECLDITTALTGAVAGDLVGLTFVRDGGDALDTVDDEVHYVGIILRVPA